MKLNNKIIFIAEAGVNHNGDISIAKKMIDVAAYSGADYVKFQSFKSELLVDQSAKKAPYQNQEKSDETQFSMLKKLEIGQSGLEELKAYSEKRNIGFLSTPFDMESAHHLVSLDLDYYKISSGDITNLPLLKYIAKNNKKFILSTGMSTMVDINNAILILHESGVNNRDIILLHCTSSYPCPSSDVNLLAIKTIAQQFNVQVGYSDHTIGMEIPIAAAGMGAMCIEKHFTLDKNMGGPDQQASIEPAELKILISYIRSIEVAMGTGVKRVMPTEKENIEGARKSIYSKRRIVEGREIKEEDLISMRPANGISPMNWRKIIGKRAVADIEIGTQINYSHLE